MLKIVFFIGAMMSLKALGQTTYIEMKMHTNAIYTAGPNGKLKQIDPYQIREEKLRRTAELDSIVEILFAKVIQLEKKKAKIEKK